ncbi:MAG: PEP-CTERM sorting domain-containing protein [Planctomycetota bacterium]|jgi:hypothetical protein
MRKVHLLVAAVALIGFLSAAEVATAGWITLAPGQSWSNGNWTNVTNGNFESGSSGWTLIPLSGANGNFTTQASPVVYSGNSGALTTTTSFSGPGYAIQRNITGLTVGQSYVLSGFLNASALTSGDLYIDLGDIPSDPTAWAPVNTNGFSWIQFTAQATSVNVRVVRDSNFINGLSGNPTGSVVVGQTGYFDEIAITQASLFQAPTAVPEPSSLACVSGLVAGLSVLSRRRRQA